MVSLFLHYFVVSVFKEVSFLVIAYKTFKYFVYPYPWENINHTLHLSWLPRKFLLHIYTQKQWLKMIFWVSFEDVKREEPIEAIFMFCSDTGNPSIFMRANATENLCRCICNDFSSLHRETWWLLFLHSYLVVCVIKAYMGFWLISSFIKIW